MIAVSGSTFNASQYINYSIAGNIANAFAIGEIGSTNDFYLVGMEPNEESLYPLLSGNIFDSEGKLLFKLRNNVITLNPGHCSKIVSNMIGYEIHDSEGELIFKVETSFRGVPNIQGESMVTTIFANFYNSEKELVFKANSGEADEMLISTAKLVLGYRHGGFAFGAGYSDEEHSLLVYLFENRIANAEPMSGLIEEQTFELNGKVLINATVRNCEILVSGGEFGLLGDTRFYDSRFIFQGAALPIATLKDGLASSARGVE